MRAFPPPAWLRLPTNTSSFSEPIRAAARPGISRLWSLLPVRTFNFDAGPVFHHLYGGADIFVGVAHRHGCAEHLLGEAGEGHRDVQFASGIERHGDVLVHPLGGEIRAEVAPEDIRRFE